MYSVSEKDMVATIAAYLESTGKKELASIIGASELTYNPLFQFSGMISNQRNLTASLRVPIGFQEKVNGCLDLLSSIGQSIYKNDSEYYFKGFTKCGIKPVYLEEYNVPGKVYLLQKDSIYANAIKNITSIPDVDPLENDYIIEACECGSQHNLLSATVMLGCAAELLLSKLADAYGAWFQKNKSQPEWENYDKKVIKASMAHKRLDEFMKRATVDKQLFMDLGVEDISLTCAFLDVIRQCRNDSGHPTGNLITEEQFKMYLSLYQAHLPKIINAIKLLPTK